MAQRSRAALVGALLAACSLNGSARAQTSNELRTLAAGAMIGTEAVLMTEAALRLKPTWAYWVGAGAGLAGGAVGGYYLAPLTNQRGSIYLLSGGIALVLPTVLAVASAMSARPTDVATTSVASRRWLDRTPTLHIAESHSYEQRAMFGATRATEVQISLNRAF
jgi:hypothetical protein